MNSLKAKTISGVLWSAIDSIAGQGLLFLVGIVLARILTPREFGLIGMITILISISESFVNSGFKSALIQKNNCTQRDYSTVFFFNVVIGIFFYLLIYLSAPAVSSFFNEPQLEKILQVLGIIIIIDSFTIVQKTIFYKNVNFRLLTKISLLAAFISGSISIAMALLNYGVWALVTQRLINQLTITGLMWQLNNWRPNIIFCKKSFKTLFSFGSKLLISGLLNTLYNNLFHLIIGKFFSATQLGYYTRANQFKSMPAEHLSGIVNRVSFPVLATLQNDSKQLREKYRILIRTISFLSFNLMMGLAAIAESLIVVLIGEKWLPSVIILQLLCFSGMFYPINYLNLNMLQVQGKANQYLHLEILKFILTIPVLIIGILTNIINLIIGLIIITIIIYIINSSWSGKFICYPIKSQIKDILPSIILSFSMGSILFIIGKTININQIVLLLLQFLIGTSIIIIVSELFKLKEYLYIKEIILDKIKRK